MQMPNGMSQSMSPQAFHLISRNELKRYVDAGMTDAEIARMYNVSTNQVNQKRRLMNLVPGQVTSEQFAEVVRLAEAVKSLPLEAIDEVRNIVNRYQP